MRGSRRLWVLATAAAFAVVALVALMFRIPAPPTPPVAARPAPAVELHEFGAKAGDSLFRDKAIFKDSVPLFLPTQWNSSPPEQARREPEGAFKNFPPWYAFEDSELQLNLPAPTAVPARPSDALEANPPGNPILGLGETDARVQALAPRWAYVEIFTAGTGRKAFAQPLTDAEDTTGAPALLRAGTWQPLDFMVAVDPAGLVGPLIPTVRSETPEDNTFLQLDGETLQWLEKYLAEKLRLGERLTPGFYRICVGP